MHWHAHCMRSIVFIRVICRCCLGPRALLVLAPRAHSFLVAAAQTRDGEAVLEEPFDLRRQADDGLRHEVPPDRQAHRRRGARQKTRSDSRRHARRVAHTRFDHGGLRWRRLLDRRVQDVRSPPEELENRFLLAEAKRCKIQLVTSALLGKVEEEYADNIPRLFELCIQAPNGLAFPRVARTRRFALVRCGSAPRHLAIV